jgi:ABC-2 type transport system permease protein
MTTSEIYSAGYRPFEGERTGWFAVVSTLTWSAVRSILGLGRPARHKVFPVIVIALAFLPAVVFVGLALLFPVDMFGSEAAPNYWELLRFTWLPVLVFSAMVVPEALVRDRRNGLFSLYLTTSLTRGRYLLGKAVASVVVLAVVISAPAILYLVGLTAEGSGPGSVLNWLGTLGGITLSGGAIAALLIGVGFAISSMTDRRAFASVALALLFLVAPIVTVALTESGMSEHWRLLDPAGVAMEFSPRLWGDTSPEFWALSNFSVFLGQILWLLASWAFVGYRYRKVSAL